MSLGRFGKAYLVAGLLGLATYGVHEFRWLEAAPEAVAKVEPGMRHSPGGWRTYAFWHRGIRGGK